MCLQPLARHGSCVCATRGVCVGCTIGAVWIGAQSTHHLPISTQQSAPVPCMSAAAAACAQLVPTMSTFTSQGVVCFTTALYQLPSRSCASKSWFSCTTQQCGLSPEAATFTCPARRPHPPVSGSWLMAVAVQLVNVDGQVCVGHDLNAFKLGAAMHCLIHTWQPHIRLLRLHAHSVSTLCELVMECTFSINGGTSSNSSLHAVLITSLHRPPSSTPLSCSPLWPRMVTFIPAACCSGEPTSEFVPQGLAVVGLGAWGAGEGVAFRVGVVVGALPSSSPLGHLSNAYSICGSMGDPRVTTTSQHPCASSACHTESQPPTHRHSQQSSMVTL